MADFSKALKVLMKAEGGYKLHKVSGDRGGLTYAGISQRKWPKWEGWEVLKKKKLTQHDTDFLKTEVRAFYKNNFWDKIGGDDIDYQKMAEAIFLHAVVSGTRTALETVQRATLNPNVDRKIGPQTLRLINIASTELLLLRMAVAKVRRRVAITRKDKSQLKFLAGWINRALKYV